MIWLFFLIVLSSTCFLSCSNFGNKTTMVKKIVFFAIPRYSEYNYGCYTFDSYIGRNPSDTVFTNRAFINKFMSSIGNLSTSEEPSDIDIYMAAIIEYRNGHQDTLCLAHHWKFGELYNSRSMRPDSLFYDFILWNAYAPLFPQYFKQEREIERSIRENDTIWFKNNRIINNDTIHEEMVPFIVDNP